MLAGLPIGRHYFASEKGCRVGMKLSVDVAPAPNVLKVNISRLLRVTLGVPSYPPAEATARILHYPLGISQAGRDASDAAKGIS